MTIEQHINSGFSAIRQGKYESALKEFDAALKLEATCELAYFGKGEVYRDTNKHHNALDMYNQSVKYQQNNIKAIALKVLMLQVLNCTAEAQVLLEKVKLAVCQNSYDFVAVGIINYAWGHYDKALAAYEESLKQDSKFALGYLLKGNIHNSLGMMKEALDAYNKAIKCDEQFVIAYNNKGNTLFSIGKINEALNEYDRALKINSQFAMAHNQKGNVLFAMGRIKEAKEEYNNAIKIDFSIAIAHLNRGNLFLQENNPREALKSYNNAIKVDSKFLAAYFQKIIVYLKQEKYEEAEACNNEIFKIQPQNIPAKIQQLEILKKLGKNEEMSKCEKSLLQLVQAEKAFYDAGNKLTAARQMEAAMACYNKAIEINPKFLPVYINKGNILLSLKRIEEAKAIFEEALKLDGNNIIIINNLGSTYLMLGNREKALECYNQALLLNPNSFDVHFNKLLLALSLERDKSPIASKTIDTPNYKDLDPKSNSINVPELPPDYLASQTQEFLRNFSGMGTISTSNNDVSNVVTPYNALKDIPAIIVKKISVSPSEIPDIVAQLLISLKSGQSWPNEIIQTVSETICQIVKTVPARTQEIVEMLANKMQPTEELEYISCLLCNIVHNVPEEANLIKGAIKNLLISDDDRVLLAASKILREIKKIKVVDVKDSSTQTNAMQYKFNVSMFNDDLDNLKLSMNDVTTEQHLIQEYIDKYKDKGVNSPDIVYGLMLSTAIVLDEIDVVKHILSKDFGNKNVLTYVDEDEGSPIGQTLYSKNTEILELIKQYIDSHSKVIKVPCEGQSLTNILNAIHWPQFENLERAIILTEYLSPLYEDSSLSPIRELIGNLEAE